MEKRVLFINSGRGFNEDMELVRRLLSKRFKVETIISDSCESIVEGFQKIKDRIDTLVIDHHMNEGIKALNNLIALAPELKVIVLSSSVYCSDENGCGHCKENYNKMRLLKPVSKKTLISAIEAFHSDRCEYDGECELPTKSFLF